MFACDVGLPPKSVRWANETQDARLSILVRVATLWAWMHLHRRLTECAAAHTQHMRKVLRQVNLRLHHVVADITGAIGMRIIRAIVGRAGEVEAFAAVRGVRSNLLSA